MSPNEIKESPCMRQPKKAWNILEVTYEGTKMVKKSKLQMLTLRFEEIRMLEDKSFNEFYAKT